MTPAPEVLFEVRGGVGFVRLNRPEALNALSLTLIEAFDARLAAWAGDGAVHAVVVRGAGDRAYCAGGDIRGIWQGGRTADGPASELFRREYMLVRRIKVFAKPYVALIGGIAMGGGIGVCVHASHRVATERTLMALPETRIGLFPDVGSSYTKGP
jgi:enoyl-CoA hydratase